MRPTGSCRSEASGRCLPQRRPRPDRETLEATGDRAGALDRALEACRVDPLNEEVHCALMRLYADLDQPRMALRQFYEAKRLLRDELGVPPAPPPRPSRARSSPTRLPTARLPPPGICCSPESAAWAARRRGWCFRSRRPRQRRAGGVARPPAVRAPPRSPFSSPTSARRPIRPERPACRGRWRQTTVGGAAAGRRRPFRPPGDLEGILIAAFASARDAVACAIACRQALRDVLTPMPPWRRACAWCCTPVTSIVPTAAFRTITACAPGSGAPALASCAPGGDSSSARRKPHRSCGGKELSVRLVDLGAYRFRGGASRARLPTAARIGARQVPAAGGAPGYVTNLRCRSTAFGREAEWFACADDHRGESALITLTGPGGSGKTRLAMQVANQLVAEFQGAVWLANLADVTDPSLLFGEILDAIGIPRSPDLEPLEQLVARVSQQRSLLLLDNFEQIAYRGARTVQTLLRRAPDLTCLVTSRTPLGVPGERQFPVAPLPVPLGPDTPRAGGLSGVRLFADRRRRCAPVQVTPTNAAAVASLCARLEGIPLALGWLRQLADRAFPNADRFAERLDWQVGTRRPATERHRRCGRPSTGASAAPRTAPFLLRLSVFRGGWTTQTAAAVCDDDLPSAGSHGGTSWRLNRTRWFAARSAMARSAFTCSRRCEYAWERLKRAARPPFGNVAMPRRCWPSPSKPPSA